MRMSGGECPLWHGTVSARRGGAVLLLTHVFFLRYPPLPRAFAPSLSFLHHFRGRVHAVVIFLAGGWRLAGTWYSCERQACACRMRARDKTGASHIHSICVGFKVGQALPAPASESTVRGLIECLCWCEVFCFASNCTLFFRVCCFLKGRKYVKSIVFGAFWYDCAAPGRTFR